MLYDTEYHHQYLYERHGRYSFALVTGPAVEPLTVAEFKAQARITSTGEDSTVLQPFIMAARQYAEKSLSRQLITATWDLRLDFFPRRRFGIRFNDYAQFSAIEIHKCPVQSVTSVKYTDTAGVEQTMDPSTYTVDVHDEPARITPIFGTYWPIARRIPNAVTVRFVAGYGDSGSDVPENLRRWICLAGATLNENREMDSETALKRLGFADSLLQSESWGDQP